MLPDLLLGRERREELVRVETARRGTLGIGAGIEVSTNQAKMSPTADCPAS